MNKLSEKNQKEFKSWLEELYEKATSTSMVAKNLKRIAKYYGLDLGYVAKEYTQVEQSKFGSITIKEVKIIK